MEVAVAKSSRPESKRSRKVSWRTYMRHQVSYLLESISLPLFTGVCSSQGEDTHLGPNLQFLKFRISQSSDNCIGNVTNAAL